jgi:hypothetical protein
MMLAIDGTPAELSMNIMYFPGGARFGFAGTNTFKPAGLLRNLRRLMRWLKLKWCVTALKAIKLTLVILAASGVTTLKARP